MGQLLYNWLNDRAAGVMLHVSSLPSDTGIDLGEGAALQFPRFWSVHGNLSFRSNWIWRFSLPCFSAFARILISSIYSHFSKKA